MNTCDTCKWWTGESEESLQTSFKQCMNPKMLSEEKGRWEPDGGPDRFEHAQPDSTICAAHDYYPAYLVVGPKFGCIHHEPND